MNRIAHNFMLAAALIFCTNSKVQASAWHFMWVGNHETRYFFDAESIERSRDLITAWVKTVQVKQPEKDGSWATAFRWRFNCTKRTVQILGWSTYDKDGKFIRSNQNTGPESAVVPDSTGEAALKIVCEPSFPQDTSGTKYFRLPTNDVFQTTKIYADTINSNIDNAPK